MDLKNLRPTQILSLKEIVVGNYETDSQDTEVKNQAYLSEQSIIQLENQCDDDNKLIRTVSRKRLSLNDLINRCESDSNKQNSYNENKKHNSLNFELPHQFNDQQIKAKVGNSPLKCEKLLQNQPKLQKFPQQQQLNKLKKLLQYQELSRISSRESSLFGQDSIRELLDNIKDDPGENQKKSQD